MNKSACRKIGVLLLLLALSAVVVLALADVPLVTRSSRHLADTDITTLDVHVHWPLVVAFVVFLAGVALILFPRRWWGPVLTLLVCDLGTAIGQTSYPRAGWETHLTQTGHGVKGTATILDERTIRLTHFSYDGVAPDMYVYLATNRTTAAFLNGSLTASPRLARAYTNETYTVQLPVGQTLDRWNAISIWCRAVQANFGWGTFAPPNRPVLSLTPLTNAVTVKLTGEAGQKYWLLSSTNLLDTNGWQTLALLTNVSGVVFYSSSPTTNTSGRYFRAWRD